MWIFWFVNHGGIVHKHSLRRELKEANVRARLAFVRQFGEDICFDALHHCCSDYLFDRFNLVRNAEQWRSELGFEGAKDGVSRMRVSCDGRTWKSLHSGSEIGATLTRTLQIAGVKMSRRSVRCWITARLFVLDDVLYEKFCASKTRYRSDYWGRVLHICHGHRFTYC